MNVCFYFSCLIVSSNRDCHETITAKNLVKFYLETLFICFECGLVSSLLPWMTSLIKGSGGSRHFSWFRGAQIISMIIYSPGKFAPFKGQVFSIDQVQKMQNSLWNELEECAKSRKKIRKKRRYGFQEISFREYGGL